MLERLLLFDAAQLLTGFAVKRPAGGGDNQPLDTLCLVALQALEDGGMLAVDGGQTDALLLCQPHHQLAAGHQRLFIGQSDVVARLDGCHRRQQSGHAHHRVENRILLRVRRYLQDPLHPAQHLGAGVLHPVFELLCRLRVGQGRIAGTVLPDLLLQQLPVAVRRQRIDRVALLLTDGQTLGSNRAGRA